MVTDRAMPSRNQERQVLMNTAIKFRRVNAALGNGTVNQGWHSRPHPQCSSGEARGSRSRLSLVDSATGRVDISSPDETIRAAQQGDTAAFEVIYQLHCRRVYVLCLRMLRDAAEAEDLSQDVFVHLFRKIHTFRGESAFSTWLHRMTVNLVLMRLRKKRQSMVSLQTNFDTGDEARSPRIDIGGPDLSLEGAVDRMNLERCIKRLPAGYRAVFVLHDIQGYRHKEIAEILGRSLGASKSQLHMAHRRLRQLLTGDHAQDRPAESQNGRPIDG